ncbi:MAG: hypothetical protein M1835_001529 [Candelina submexicana]|nr:MAG: hypothetical protein M1835_001529 [Candelina submexicana]
MAVWHLVSFLTGGMSTAYENLKEHLQLAVRQLKQIKAEKKKFDVEELIGLESQVTDLITELVDAAEEEA